MKKVLLGSLVVLSCIVIFLGIGGIIKFVWHSGEDLYSLRQIQLGNPIGFAVTCQYYGVQIPSLGIEWEVGKRCRNI